MVKGIKKLGRVNQPATLTKTAKTRVNNNTTTVFSATLQSDQESHQTGQAVMASNPISIKFM